MTQHVLPIPPCPFPDPTALDADGLQQLAVTLSGLAGQSRSVFKAVPNAATKWILERDELAADWIGSLLALRVSDAIDSGELD